jgi:starch phosphorylase
VISVADDAGTASLLGRTFTVTVNVALGDLKPTDVRVQAVVGKVGLNRELLNTRVETLEFDPAQPDALVFRGVIACDTPGHQGYTVRVIPSHPDVSVPSELGLATWE